jgi:hypothetical protein
MRDSQLQVVDLQLVICKNLVLAIHYAACTRCMLSTGSTKGWLLKL